VSSEDTKYTYIYIYIYMKKHSHQCNPMGWPYALKEHEARGGMSALETKKGTIQLLRCQLYDRKN